jgi:hypothetical protein
MNFEPIGLNLPSLVPIQDAPVPQPTLEIYQPTVVGPNIPTRFCIRSMRSMNGQMINGFYLLNSEAIEGQTSFRITRVPNLGRFYPLINVNITTPAANNHRVHIVKLKKPRGQTDHECRWRYTSECLKYQNEFYPVLTVTPAAFLESDIIKHESSWVPLQNEVNKLRIKVDAKPIEIPTHAVLALLRDAAIQGSTCPITTEEIDVSNGAVTSCFHLFEKNSIATWLASEKSKKQCPVCKKECRSFTL